MYKYETDVYYRKNFYSIVIFALEQIWSEIQMQRCKQSSLLLPPPFLLEGGLGEGIAPPIKFLKMWKKGGLTGPQILNFKRKDC